MDERLSALEFRRKGRGSPEAERALLDLVRTGDAAGARFRRNHPVGPYVLDLYSPEHHLAVELEAPARAAPEGRFHDEVRTRYLGCFGIRVLTFTDAEVLRESSRVAQEIGRALAGAAVSAPATARIARR